MTASQKKLTVCPIQTTCSEWFLFYHKPGADPPDQEKTRRGSGRNRASRPEVPGYGQPASRIPLPPFHRGAFHVHVLMARVAPSLADHPALGAAAVHAVPLDRPARGRVYHGTGPHPDRDALFQHRGYPRLERQQRRRLGPRTPRLPRQPVAAGGGAHTPRRGRHDPREGQPRLYDPADRGKLHLHAGELPHFQPVPEASGKPGRSVGNRGPALFRKGQARAFRSRFRQGGYALPLYGRPARQGKLHPVPSGQEGRRRARRHQRIHLRRAPFCSGDRTQAHHRARIRDHRDHRHGGDRRGHVPDQPQEGACRSRQPHQERLPRQHDPRYAYPADRHPRHDRTAGTRNAGFASPLSARQPPEGHRQPAYGRRRHHALFTA